MKNFVFFIIIFLSGLSYSQVKVNIKEAILDKLEKADSLVFTSNYSDALQLSKESLDLSLKIKDASLIALSYNSLAGSFEEINELEEALKCYKKGLDYIKDNPNDTVATWLYNNIGNVYLYFKKDYKKSLPYYDKSIELCKKLKDSVGIALSKMNKTWAYFKMQDFKKGIEEFSFAEKLEYFLDYPDIKIYMELLRAMKYAHLNDKEKAKNSFLNAIAIGKKNDYKSYLADAYEEYSRYLYKLGNYKEAFEYLNLNKEVKNQIFDQEKLKNTQIVKSKLALETYQERINEIEKEKSIQAEKLRNTRVIVILFIVFFSIILLYLYTLYKNDKFKNSINLYLSQKNDELNEAKERAEEASKLKTQFISTISHELRTPLYGVVGITNILADEHKELKNSLHLKSLKFSARYLLSLVNDLLQINRIEENKVVLENHTFNLNDEISTVVHSLQFIADRNSNKIITEIDENIPEYLIGDKLRLSQILMNLVSNALKFTRDGSVTIALKLLDNKNDKATIHFAVSDTGVGISEKDIDKIFEKFVQIDRKEDDYQGAGLGLSIVKKLIALFDSDISVTSKLGEGTTFTFDIVFDSNTQKVQELINEIKVDLSLDYRYSVLIVEDNRINQMVTKKIMDKNNVNCTIVDNGYAAIEVLEKEKFDVILMDINMPLINGFETTRKIRQKGYNIPIIALTAFAKDEVIDEALSSGMNDVLIKPFEGNTLFQIIENQLKK